MHDFITTLPTTSAPSKMHHHHPQSKHKESMSTLAGACWATAPLKFIILNSNFFTPLAAVFFTLWIVSLRHYTSSVTALPFRWRRLLLYRWFSYIAGLTSPALQPAKSVTAWSFNKMSPTAIQFLRQKNMTGQCSLPFWGTRIQKIYYFVQSMKSHLLDLKTTCSTPG